MLDPGHAAPLVADSSADSAQSVGSALAPQPRVAYLASRFPKLTETFILFEVLEVERQGVHVELYALQRERSDFVHPEAAAMLDRVHFQPFFGLGTLRAHLFFLRRAPARYFAALFALLRGNLGSARYLAGAIVFFPKIVAFAREMLEARVSHVHAHFASHPAAAAFVIHRLTGIPYSFTAHGSDLHRDRTMLAEKLREASAVVTVSEFNRRVILDECGEDLADRVHVIHCGVSPEVFRPAERSEARERDPGPLRIVCTGTLHEVKGQTYLLEACGLLDRRGVKFDCELIGTGPDREALEAQVDRLGLSGSVRFLGAQTQLEVARRLQWADVVVAPSVPTSDGRREGIPVALMEAMSSGCAVIASRLTGIPELVEGGVAGLLTEPGSAGEIADALERLAHSPELRARMGTAARAKVMSDFALAKNAAALRTLFQHEAAR